MKRRLPFVIIIAALAVTLVTAWYFKRSSTRSPLTAGLSGQRQSGPVREGATPAHSLGSIDAAVMLEEFADFQCSACGKLHPTLDDLKDAFGSRLVIVFRQFPLVNAHANALIAARAAEAAGLQGKFWQMHDALFEHQEDWRDVADPKSLFDEYATRIGLDVGKFQADMTSQTVEQRIALDKERGRWIGVNSTPTVFLNGREIALESLSTDTLRELINKEIAAGK